MMGSLFIKIQSLYSEVYHSEVQVVVSKYVLIYSVVNGTIELEYFEKLLEEDIVSV